MLVFKVHKDLYNFKDTTYSGDGYAYDINGNVVKDYSRNMYSGTGNGAHYNLLDKPDSMVISQKATFQFFYDAAGNMLSKNIRDHNGGIEKTYLYINGFVYLNDTLQYVQHEEGRIRWAAKIHSQTGALYRAFEYDYYLRDHLSNPATGGTSRTHGTYRRKRYLPLCLFYGRCR